MPPGRTCIRRVLIGLVDERSTQKYQDSVSKCPCTLPVIQINTYPQGKPFAY